MLIFSLDRCESAASGELAKYLSCYCPISCTELEDMDIVLLIHSCMAYESIGEIP